MNGIYNDVTEDLVKATEMCRTLLFQGVFEFWCYLHFNKQPWLKKKRFFKSETMRTLALFLPLETMLSNTDYYKAKQTR